MNTRTNRLIASASLALGIAAGTSHAQVGVNLLVDPGFENNALGTFVGVLTTPLTPGVWGVEVATIVGIVPPVVPQEGSKMLSMTDDGLIATQAVQVTDVTSFGSLINAGNATVNLSAWFNVDGPTGAIASVGVWFLPTNVWNQNAPSFFISGPVDTNPDGWQFFIGNQMIPTGTQYLVTQVAYNSASLGGLPGYVDNVNLQIIPAPASAGLLLLGGVLTARRRRTR